MSPAQAHDLVDLTAAGLALLVAQLRDEGRGRVVSCM
jgi:hypothetical protein